jgi:hypothetical protein
MTMTTADPATSITDDELDASLNPATIEFLRAIDALRDIDTARTEHDQIPPPGPDFWKAADDVILAARLLGTPSTEEHPLALAVARFAVQVRLHERESEQRSRSYRESEFRYPSESFLRVMATLFETRERFGVPDDGPRSLEPIVELIGQGVSRRQIATMYGLTLNELEEEIERPGSMTSKPGYVSPHERQLQQEKAREAIEINGLGGAAAAIAMKRSAAEQERALAKL